MLNNALISIYLFLGGEGIRKNSLGVQPPKYVDEDPIKVYISIHIGG